MISRAKTLLKKIFGYADFRPLQENIISNVLLKKDTLVIMPTGAGKSLCYQIPALIFDGLTIVVSPLISLMNDQVEQLRAWGISAVYLNSSLPKKEYQSTKVRIRRGEVKLLYMAPETLLMPGILTFLQHLTVSCITIDEAHCISEWGHEFRPEYRQLIEIRRQFPKAVCIALTATATPRVQQDIKTSLGFESDNSFIASFNRENLFLQIIPKTDPYFQIIDFLKKYPDQSGIIYCFSRRQVDDLSADLASDGVSVLPYHAGLDDTIRKNNQEAFIRDNVRIIVATIAFGMGINKPNVRFVIHHDLPKNIESYYQQIGRAGRDGLRAHCLLLFSYGDLQKINYFIRQMSGQEKRAAKQQLNALVKFAESRTCRRQRLLSYFGETVSFQKCGMCDNCLGPGKPLEDITAQAQMFLSCVKRTGESFGAGHIIDILRGSECKKVKRFGHDRLSTYGVGEDYSKKAWQHYSRQFIALDLLNQDSEHLTLQLTDKAWQVLKNREPVMGAHIPVAADYSKFNSAEPDYDPELFDILRKKRKELADDADVPPYVIFPDRTLMQMASFYPCTKEALGRIHGVGRVKMESYGSIFIYLINRYCDKKNIPLNRTFQQSEREMRPSRKMRRFFIVGEAYNNGESIAALMERYRVKKTTIIQHLYRYLQSGGMVSINGLIDHSSLNPSDRQRVLEAFHSLGTERLGPVYDALDGEISFDELHLLRIVYLADAMNTVESE
ncbi:DNA helicase RecQ [bacterium]|nr:DNA helicase RecQ [bacterium]